MWNNVKLQQIFLAILRTKRSVFASFRIDAKQEKLLQNLMQNSNVSKKTMRNRWMRCKTWCETLKIVAKRGAKKLNAIKWCETGECHSKVIQDRKSVAKLGVEQWHTKKTDAKQEKAIQNVMQNRKIQMKKRSSAAKDLFAYTLPIHGMSRD